ncbi:hypothetical protein BG011_003326 [Mortierella polycephala]|uniref:Rad4-domain-containing protein n=1 Tax=Mortierella polycephala TaxID=41804 RepID=A0A9P6U461_9FUNG|nr:hypothetical protein BG011_003326 [Mortierella polycephala]
MKKRTAEQTSSSIKKQKQKKIESDDFEYEVKQEDEQDPDMDTLGSNNMEGFDGDDDDGSEWEEVAISEPTLTQGDDYCEEEEQFEEDEELSGPWQYNAVEIVFDKPLEQGKKATNRGITKEERMIRVLIHQTHLLCLIASGLRRNQWINHSKLHSMALSLVPAHIVDSIQTTCTNPTQEVNALQVLALWWRDFFAVTGPGIQNREYMDVDVVGVEAAIPISNEECLKQRKNLQRRLQNRQGSSDVCAQLFTGICRSLGLRARLVESLQACPFKIAHSKDEAPAESSAGSAITPRKGKRKKEVKLDESDTTRGSRVVIPTPHRQAKKSTKVPPNHKQADPPVFWTEVYSMHSKKWIVVDPIRGFVNTPLKMHPPSSCAHNKLAYVAAYDEDNYVTDVTRRYTSRWGSTTKRLRVQPAGPDGFDWWAQTMSGIMNPHPTLEADLEEAELLQSEVSERMPAKLGDFNNHPLYALERHLKKHEVLHPKFPVLGHIRGETIYPRSCVKPVRSKENWLKRARVVKSDELIPTKWIKARPATVFQIRLRQQAMLSGDRNISKQNQNRGHSDGHDEEEVSENGNGDQVPLWGEWQTEAYQPPWVVDGKVPRNEFGQQNIFTPAMVPIGGAHLKGSTGFEFQSRRSVPVVQGIIVPAESAELVLDAFHEMAHHADQEADKRRRVETLKRWRKLIKAAMMRSRLLEEYGEGLEEDGDDDKDSWVPKDEDDDGDAGEDHERDQSGMGGGDKGPSAMQMSSKGSSNVAESKDGIADADMDMDSGAGFMLD